MTPTLEATARSAEQAPAALPAIRPGAIALQAYRSREVLFGRLLFMGLTWGDLVAALGHGLGPSNWADWHRSWTDLGLHFEDLARQAERRGSLLTRRQFLLKAAAAHHVAEFFYFENPKEKEISRRRVSDLFRAALPCFNQEVDTAIEEVLISYEDTPMPGYLVHPTVCGRATAPPRPLVVLVNGGDSAKEVELWAFAQPLLQRGLSVLMFDAPGQGELLGKGALPIEFETVLASVLDFLDQRSDIDSSRIGIFGVSVGGYLAMRAAAHQPDRIHACVNLSGGFDMDDFSQKNPLYQANFRYIFQVDDPQAMIELAREQLHLRSTPALQAPLLCLHAEQDTIVPLESCLRATRWATGPVSLWTFPTAGHVCTDFFGEILPRFSDWLEQRLNNAESKQSRHSHHPTSSLGNL